MNASEDRVWRAVVALRRQGWRVEPNGRSGRREHRLMRRGSTRVIVLGDDALVARGDRAVPPLQLEFAFS